MINQNVRVFRVCSCYFSSFSSSSSSLSSSHRFLVFNFILVCVFLAVIFISWSPQKRNRNQHFIKWNTMKAQLLWLSDCVRVLVMRLRMRVKWFLFHRRHSNDVWKVLIANRTHYFLCHASINNTARLSIESSDMSAPRSLKALCAYTRSCRLYTSKHRVHNRRPSEEKLMEGLEKIESVFFDSLFYALNKMASVKKQWEALDSLCSMKIILFSRLFA